MASDENSGEFEYVAPRWIFFFSDNRIGVGMVGSSAGTDGFANQMHNQVPDTVIAVLAGRSACSPCCRSPLITWTEANAITSALATKLSLPTMALAATC